MRLAFGWIAYQSATAKDCQIWQINRFGFSYHDFHTYQPIARVKTCERGRADVDTQHNGEHLATCMGNRILIIIGQLVQLDHA